MKEAAPCLLPRMKRRAQADGGGKGGPPVEIRHLGGDTWYFPGRVNVGLFRHGGGAWLVDSGLDDDAGRKIARHLEEEGTTLRRIVTTHSNADHCGANAFLHRRTGCSVAATAMEATVMENPTLEPMLLWSAFPFEAIRNKFLQAKASKVDLIIANSGAFDESGLEAVPLPGHFLDMIGVRTPDDVLFTADALFSGEVIEKYGIMFVLDVQGALDTFDRLEATEARWFVPSHAPATEDIGPLVETNRRGMLRIGEMILDCCTDPSSREFIVAAVAERLGLSMTPSEYVLNSAAISAHLTRLARNGALTPAVEEGVLLWRRS